MAGRPLIRAKRFADWEDRLWGLLMEFCDLAPNPPVRQRTPGGIDFWGETFQLLQHTTIAAGEAAGQAEQAATKTLEMAAT